MISVFYYVVNPSFARGGMGQGMMGTQGDSKEESPIIVNASQAKELLSYVQEQRLQCMQCHAISKNMFGPSFASVSARYAHQKDAVLKLSDHIAHGFGRMPPGLANNRQADDLAKLIISLAEEPKKSENQ